MLQGPGSDVQLHIPEGLHGFISGHAHTDPTPFLDHIPESDCLVSPIAEYNCSFTSSCPKRLFEIIVPHCVRNQEFSQHIRVWHGDTHNKTPFLDKSTFVVDEKYIKIQTYGFSQFFCTIPGCQESCYGNPKAFIFGRITNIRIQSIFLHYSWMPRKLLWKSQSIYFWPYHAPEIPSHQISSQDLHVQPPVRHS